MRLQILDILDIYAINKKKELCEKKIEWIEISKQCRFNQSKLEKYLEKKIENTNTSESFLYDFKTI